MNKFAKNVRGGFSGKEKKKTSEEVCGCPEGRYKDGWCKIRRNNNNNLV